ncbi:hypothetical protein B0H16DRAFT_1764005 [Mycena metata]|uniref:Uncharacterized protein n=1 Tax=Mycena metata TaxID=1033252 RepID=A0AAD7I8S2_9AGAR|nr:hypothetical protein B0H16DRAFT_1764005 [Mycena metata]
MLNGMFLSAWNSGRNFVAGKAPDLPTYGILVEGDTQLKCTEVAGANFMVVDLDFTVVLAIPPSALRALLLQLDTVRAASLDASTAYSSLNMHAALSRGSGGFPILAAYPTKTTFPGHSSALLLPFRYRSVPPDNNCPASGTCANAPANRDSDFGGHGGKNSADAVFGAERFFVCGGCSGPNCRRRRLRAASSRGVSRRAPAHQDVLQGLDLKEYLMDGFPKAPGLEFVITSHAR